MSLTQLQKDSRYAPQQYCFIQVEMLCSGWTGSALNIGEFMELMVHTLRLVTNDVP